jgi:hypothetical protein
VFARVLNVHISIAGLYIRLSDTDDIVGIMSERIIFRSAGQKRLLEFEVLHFQIDDLASVSKFPVVMAPNGSGRNIHLGKGLAREKQFFKVLCSWFSVDKSIVHLNCVDVCLEEISLKLSLDFVMRVISCIGKAADLFSLTSNTSNISDVKAVRAVFDMTISDRIFRNSSILNDAYFCIKHFHHNRIVIHGEIFVGSKLLHLDTNLMDRSIAVGLSVLGGPVMSFISSVVGSIAHVSPVFVFQDFLVTNFFGNTYKFWHMIYTILNQQAFNQAYKLFGSLELIGNPLSFIDNISSGVTDFYAQTWDELGGNSSTRGEGVRRLAFSVISGTFGTASRVTGSLASLSRVISGKSDQRIDSGAPDTITEGLQLGGGVLLRSVEKGLTGLIYEPARGLQKEGLFGVVKGMGKGVIRLFASPVTGTLEALSLVAETIESQAHREGKPCGRITRVRLLIVEAPVNHTESQTAVEK